MRAARWRVLVLSVLSACLSACSSPRTGVTNTPVPSAIVVAGHRVPIDAPVVLWTDPGGYDAYRDHAFFAPDPGDPAPRFGVRAGLPPRAGAHWALHDVQRVVDQFVVHYDVAGTSRTCFRVLHDRRRLSVHFLLDLDGTIYQTLDVQERAWHATKANDRSVGVEIANIGAYPSGDPGPLSTWYEVAHDGRTRIRLPAHLGDGGVRTPGFVARPARPAPVVGEINGQRVMMYDLTPEQYRSLRALTDALCRALPRLERAAPRTPDGRVIPHQLTDAAFDSHRGLLGHYHVQDNKIDPGPAFDWDRVLAP